MMYGKSTPWPRGLVPHDFLIFVFLSRYFPTYNKIFSSSLSENSEKKKREIVGYPGEEVLVRVLLVMLCVRVMHCVFHIEQDV